METKFPNADDLLNFELVIIPDEGKLTRFAFGARFAKLLSWQ
jgi:hypothetical protein